MRIRGKLKNVSKDWENGRWNITIEMDEGHIQELEKFRDKDLAVEIKKYYEKRTNRANRYMWECINTLAFANPKDPDDPWDVYLDMLRKYGVKKYGIFRPDAVEAVKLQWRETIDLGAIEVNGQEARQLMLCFGSSTYNKAEFSKLLNGIIKELISNNLDVPPTEEMQRALQELEERENGKETT